MSRSLTKCGGGSFSKIILYMLHVSCVSKSKSNIQTSKRSSTGISIVLWNETSTNPKL